MVANLLMARRETDASIKNMIHLFQIENIHSLLREVSDILDRKKENKWKWAASSAYILLYVLDFELFFFNFSPRTTKASPAPFECIFS